VAGKIVMVEPPESDPRNLPNRDAHGNDKPEHTNGQSQEDGRCLCPAVENSPKIMKCDDLDGTLRIEAWRSS
jgi:hypothetical protein